METVIVIGLYLAAGYCLIDGLYVLAAVPDQRSPSDAYFGMFRGLAALFAFGCCFTAAVRTSIQ